MKRFVEGEDRTQGVLLPEFLDDYVAEDNPVRVIDVFVDELDLRALGFEGVVAEATGRPAYHPATMLKLYFYGYINQIQSSRRLERETARNVEMMWLTGRLTPDFKTIADFRKDNGAAIRSACRQFVALCRNLNLFTHAIVAIDGSRFKACNSRDRSFSRASIERRIEQVEASIERYLSALETSDRQEGELAEARSARLKDKIALLREQMREYKALEVAVHAAPDKQISLTDPDARSMATTGKDTGLVDLAILTALIIPIKAVEQGRVTVSCATEIIKLNLDSEDTNELMTLPQPDIPRNVERLKKEAKRKEAFERMTPAELEALADADTSDADNHAVIAAVAKCQRVMRDLKPRLILCVAFELKDWADSLGANQPDHEEMKA